MKLILLELNELSPDLMSRFIDEGELPNFRRLRAQSTLYTTDACANARFQSEPLLAPILGDRKKGAGHNVRYGIENSKSIRRCPATPVCHTQYLVSS